MIFSIFYKCFQRSCQWIFYDWLSWRFWILCHRYVCGRCSAWEPKRALLKQRGNRVPDFIQNWAGIHSITIYFDKSFSITFGKQKILKRNLLFKLHVKSIKSENSINTLTILESKLINNYHSYHTWNQNIKR